MLLGEMENDIIDKFGYLKTSNEDIERIMKELGVNILPIIDSERLLLGIQTRENITVSVSRYYTTKLGAQVEESILRSEIESGNTGGNSVV